MTPPMCDILIVEDDLGFCEMLATLLELEGYHISCARDGQAALDLLATRANLPSVILLDLMMPGMDGMAFRLAQQHTPHIQHIPVILMSASGEQFKEDVSSRMTGVTVLPKPFQPHQLLALVAQQCHAVHL